MTAQSLVHNLLASPSLSRLLLALEESPSKRGTTHICQLSHPQRCRTRITILLREQDLKKGIILCEVHPDNELKKKDYSFCWENYFWVNLHTFGVQFPGLRIKLAYNKKVENIWYGPG